MEAGDVATRGYTYWFSLHFQSLDTVFQKSLKNSTAYNEFKRMSQMFLDGQYNGAAYYEQCKCALGDRFNDTFPELIALLPNIAKQQVRRTFASMSCTGCTQIN